MDEFANRIDRLSATYFICVSIRGLQSDIKFINFIHFYIFNQNILFHKSAFGEKNIINLYLLANMLLPLIG